MTNNISNSEAAQGDNSHLERYTYELNGETVLTTSYRLDSDAVEKR